MKHICFLVDSIFTVGGVQRVTRVIAEELAKDFDVTIVTLDQPPLIRKDDMLTIHHFAYPDTPQWKLPLCKAYSYLYRKFLPQNKFTSALYAHSSFPAEKRKALAKELQQGHYDVIIGVHAPLAVRLAACRKQLNGTKLIGWIHNSYEALFGEASRYLGPELRKHYEWQLYKLDETVVLCQHDAKAYHIPTKVIYNPLTLIPGEPSKGTSKKFLAVGRFSPLHKGFDLLIQAFALFAKKNSEWTLDIVGEGDEEQSYRSLIAQNHLEDRITIHPFTDHIQTYYSEAQVYVLSSRWEGLPLVLIEAMAHGLPIVSSDLNVSKEIMDGFGLYFKNGDVADLARCLQQATAIDWSQKSKEAMAIACRFDIKAIAAQWQNLINE
ncbi:glycosyltransferase [Prevotella sp. E13-17]|uniref:glycosyltransferase n=1 Tax=Prevotella sp. E13-17 TaxID=2913616 RepID=UPI001EDA4AD8|nr:glycosyltransferase [Prevotella sp. E13-17]UKK51888.1 glycosyltransferase [Prevotella sp. E13-17]